jgi:hypothetical protein
MAKHFDLIGGKLLAGDSTQLRAQNSKKIERHVVYIHQNLLKEFLLELRFDFLVLISHFKAICSHFACAISLAIFSKTNPQACLKRLYLAKKRLNWS